MNARSPLVAAAVVALAVGSATAQTKRRADPPVSYPSWSAHTPSTAPTTEAREEVSLETLRRFPERFSGRLRMTGTLRLLEREQGEEGDLFYFQIENDTGTLGSRRAGQFALLSRSVALASALTDRRYPETMQVVTLDMRETTSTDARYAVFYRFDIAEVAFVDVEGRTVAAIN